MKRLLYKYAEKLVIARLAEQGAPLIGGIDAEIVWNREDPARAELDKVLTGLNINSLLYCQPAEPYRTIIEYLARHAPVGPSGAAIEPSDCETRTFMHDLPVAPEFDAALIIQALKRRKSVIIPGRGVVTWGTVSPEQAFIFYSSLCFACYVKFFSDYLADARASATTDEQRQVFQKAAHALDRADAVQAPPPAQLMRGPFENEEEVYRAVSQAGRMTVQRHLVDSFFGNVSYLRDSKLYISQTGSSLDELEGCIDCCPLDNSSCAAITASSEYTAHREMVTRTGARAILHGHPKFSVILSLACDKRADCEREGQCHIKCSEERFAIADVPIVPGEVGFGPRGLCNTLPPAIEKRRGAIVYGHGLFTVGGEDFNEAFASLLDIERACQKEYFKRLEN